MTPAAVDERTAVGLAILEGRSGPIRELHAAGGLEPLHAEAIAAAVDLIDAGRKVSQRAILPAVESSPAFDPVQWSQLGTAATQALDAWTAAGAVRAFLADRQRRDDIATLKRALESAERGGDPDEYLGEIREQLETTEAKPGTSRQIMFNAAELMRLAFDPIEWIIPGLLTVGLSLLVGVAKLGKSWLVLAIVTAVSVGGRVLGSIPVAKTKVLLLALEDTARRLQSRLHQIGAIPSEVLTIALEWPTGPAGITKLDKWLTENPDAGLVVIDTLGKFYPLKDGNDYHETVRATGALKQLADKHEVAILAIHHSKKAATDDFLQSTLGSTGIAATADNTLLLRRARGKRDATLHITGRDVEEQEFVLKFDGNAGTWTMEGTAAEVQESDARQAVYDWLKEHEPATPKEIHKGMSEEGAARSYSTVKRLLGMMQESGVVVSMSGVYRTTDGKNREPYEPTNTMNPMNPVNPAGTNAGSVHGSRSSRFTQSGNEPDPERERWLDEHKDELF
jgi:hypothetical protein